MTYRRSPTGLRATKIPHEPADDGRYFDVYGRAVLFLSAESLDVKASINPYHEPSPPSHEDMRYYHLYQCCSPSYLGSIDRSVA